MEKGKSEPRLTEPIGREDEFEPRPLKTLDVILNRKNTLYEKILFVHGFDFSSNVYVINNGYITIVDPGNDYTAFMELFELGFAPEDIKKIALTHGHRDHAMGMLELLRAYPSIMEAGGFDVIMHKDGPEELKELLGQVGIKPTEIEGGETLDFSGFEFEAIYTPGHTMDGVSYYHEPTRTAITGDTVLPHAMVETDKNAGGDLHYYLYALKLLREREIDDILPGHGDPVPSLGKEVLEKTYEHAMMKVAELEPGTSWGDGAMALAQKGLLEEAIFCCEKCLVMDPHNVNALQLKAMCLNDLGRCQEALEGFERVLELESDHLFAITGKGSALLGLGRYEESIEYFDRAVEINPAMKDAMVFKGMALYLSGKGEEAMDIDGFRTEFVERFKYVLEKQKQPDEDDGGLT